MADAVKRVIAVPTRFFQKKWPRLEKISAGFLQNRAAGRQHGVKSNGKGAKPTLGSLDVGTFARAA